MNPPPRPEIDRRLFGSDFLQYHERLVPFFDGTIAALSSLAGLQLMTRSPLRITVPDDWVVPTPSAGWAGLASNPPTAYRKLDDGTVQVRGRINFTSGSPSTQAPIIPIPSGWEPKEREVMDCYATIGGAYTPAVLTCHTQALRWITGGYNNLSFSGDVFWTAANRAPAAWGAPFPLPVNGPSLPSLVLVVAQLIGPDKRPATQWQVHPAAWSAPPERSSAAFMVTRVPGLSVGVTYDLMVYAAV